MGHHGHLLIDANNLGFAATSTRVLSVGEQQTQGVLGVLRAVRQMAITYPQLRPLILWDGDSWRKKEIEGYKASRDAKATSKHEEQQAAVRASWRSQRPIVAKALKMCGVAQLTSANLEADDWAGILVRRYAPTGAKVLMISADKDWLQLVRPGVAWHDPIRRKRITAATFEKEVGYMKTKKVKQDDGSVLEEDVEWRGVPSPQAFLEVKALMGDTSDEIPGVGGIGERGAIDLVRKFGTVKAFLNKVEIEKADLPKKLTDFAGDEAKLMIFYRNLRLMDLCHPDIPKPVRPRVIEPAFSIEAFTGLCEELLFNQMLADVDAWMAPFRPAGQVSTDLKEAA